MIVRLTAPLPCRTLPDSGNCRGRSRSEGAPPCDVNDWPETSLPIVTFFLLGQVHGCRKTS